MLCFGHSGLVQTGMDKETISISEQKEQQEEFLSLGNLWPLSFYIETC
jgi:hypothetical protein